MNALEDKRGGLEKQKVCDAVILVTVCLPLPLNKQLADSMKRFSYLLGQTELFQHFVDIKVSRN